MRSGTLGAGAEQDDLRAADAERLARALEQVDERGLDVGRAAERARDAVEELERLVLRVLGQVGAVGEHQYDGGRDDQPARVPVACDQRRAREPDARVGERDHQVGAVHRAPYSIDGSVPSARAITASTSAAATSEPAPTATNVAAPHGRADLDRRGDQRVQHDDGEDRGERELGDVERDLDRRAAARRTAARGSDRRPARRSARSGPRAAGRRRAAAPTARACARCRGCARGRRTPRSRRSRSRAPTTGRGTRPCRPAGRARPPDTAPPSSPRCSATSSQMAAERSRTFPSASIHSPLQSATRPTGGRTSCGPTSAAPTTGGRSSRSPRYPRTEPSRATRP